MPWLADTATPVVIITAHETLKLTECVREFLKKDILNKPNDDTIAEVRFLNAATLPLHGLRSIEFIGFSEASCSEINSSIDSFRDYFLPELNGEVLVIVNPAKAHVVRKL